MSEVKGPSMLAAVLMTIAAVCSMMSFVLMAAGGKRSGGLVIFQLFTAGIMAIAAIANWVVYFKKYVDFKIENQLKEKEQN